jgi:hypothetical protein
LRFRAMRTRNEAAERQKPYILSMAPVYPRRGSAASDQLEPD